MKRTYVKLGNREYQYENKKEAWNDWMDKFHTLVLAGAGFHDLAYIIESYAHMILDTDDNDENSFIQIPSNEILPLIDFWYSDQPIDVVFGPFVFQYENPRDAYLGLDEIDGLLLKDFGSTPNDFEWDLIETFYEVLKIFPSIPRLICIYYDKDEWNADCYIDRNDNSNE